MTVAPKCKLCGRREWGNCNHGFNIGTVLKLPAKPRPVTEPSILVTKVSSTVTKVPTIVTKGTTIVTPVTKTGRPRKYGSDAERQAAFRVRRAQA